MDLKDDDDEESSLTTISELKDVEEIFRHQNTNPECFVILLPEYFLNASQISRACGGTISERAREQRKRSWELFQQMSEAMGTNSVPSKLTKC